MLVKLTPGLNFINVLRTAFTRADPRRVKNTVKFSIFFMLSGSMSVKALHKRLVKLTLGLSNNKIHLTAIVEQKREKSEVKAELK